MRKYCGLESYLNMTRQSESIHVQPKMKHTKRKITDYYRYQARYEKQAPPPVAINPVVKCKIRLRGETS